MKTIANKIEKMLEAIERMDAYNEAYNEASRNLNPEYETITVCGQEFEIATKAYDARITALNVARLNDTKATNAARRAVKSVANSLGFTIKTELDYYDTIAKVGQSLAYRFSLAMEALQNINKYDQYLTSAK